MGMLVEGVWKDIPRQTTEGAFVRPDAAFRGAVSRGGPYPPEAGRYRLYVSRACPWAHRTLIVRALKGLEKAIPAYFADPYMAENGWTFTEGGFACLHQLYSAAKPDYTGRASVPVLWDSRTRTIVCNESSEIIRLLNREFDEFATRRLHDLYPERLRKEIDAVNERVYRTLNNGVYRAGFATAQGKYEQAVTDVFRTLDWLEKRLARRSWLCGTRFTEADVRLFTTLVRFDAVYHGHFKCNIRRLIDYRHLWAYTRDVYQIPGVAQTVNFTHIKRHYYQSHKRINPSGIVPVGPLLDFDAPAERGKDITRLLNF